MSQNFRILLVLVAVTIFIGWASDSITLQGERTVYTANCSAGVWRGATCTGTMVVGPRYRFRALKAHGEVIFWTSGEAASSSKFTDCIISDGRNWTCKANAEIGRAITNAMVDGRPIPEAGVQTREFHQIPKWQWGMATLGLPIFGDAMN